MSVRWGKGRVVGGRSGFGRRVSRLPFLFLFPLFVAGCGRKELPKVDEPQRPVPNLVGLKVMVLPSQPGPGGVPVGLDDAIAANLEAVAPSVDWVLPAEVERALTRAPWLEIRPRALPVSMFRSPEMTHVTEPLYGQMRRLGALVDARYALLPVAAGYVQGTEPGQQGRIEVAAALVDTVGGRVLWYGVVAGARGAANDEVVIGTAAQAVAAMVAPSG